MKPALVFATWNGWELTARFLDSIDAHARRDWRLVAVDNGSTDGSADRLEARRGRHELRVLRNGENLGCAKAWNRGIREALAGGAPYVGVLNNDLVFGPGWDEGLLGFAATSGARAFCPHVDEGPLAGFDERARRFARRNHARTRLRMRSEAMFFARDVFEDVGLYDERFFVSYEDFDYFLRLEAAGIRPVETGAAVVWHQAKSTRRHLPADHEVEGRRLFVEKWGEHELRHPGFEIPRGQRRLWRWRERFGFL